jgi:hypothetical protein
VPSLATRVGAATVTDLTTKADKTTTISAAGLATGGGSLAADRTITVTKATATEVEAALIDTKAVTPLSLSAVLSTINVRLSTLEDNVEQLYEIIGQTLPEAIILVSYGQSLAMGREPNVSGVVNTISNYIMPAEGTEIEKLASFGTNDAHMIDMDVFKTWAPFHEYEGRTVPTVLAPDEGWGSGLGYQLRLNPDNGPMSFFCPADGARHWRELAPGTGRWGNMIGYVRSANEYFRAAGEYNIGIRFFWTQLEADCDVTAPGGGTNELLITAAETAEMLEKVLSYFHHDMTICFDKDMTGEPIYVTPLNSAAFADILLTDPHPRRGAASRYAQQGQLQAAQDNPLIVLLPPHYQFYTSMNTDGVHLGGQGRRYYAELAASVAERVEAGQLYKPPHVVSATRSGAVITATCYFPGGGGGVVALTPFGDPVDATLWPDQKNGVQFWFDSTQAFLTVSTVAIVGSTLTVTLAANPGAGSGELRIAQLPYPGGLQSNTRTARSNLRDATLSVTAQDSTVLYHYMIPQTVSVA